MHTVAQVAGAMIAMAGVQSPPWAAATIWRSATPGAPELRRVHEAVYRKFEVDYLQVAFYVDLVGLGRRPRGQAARPWLLRGGVWCGRRSRVLQEIGPAKRVEGLVAQLQAHWPAGAFDPERPSVRRLLRAAARPLEYGDAIDYLWEPGGRVHLRMGADPWLVLSDPVLHQALLRIAFDNRTDGDRPALDRALDRAAQGP